MADRVSSAKPPSVSERQAAAQGHLMPTIALFLALLRGLPGLSPSSGTCVRVCTRACMPVCLSCLWGSQCHLQARSAVPPMPAFFFARVGDVNPQVAATCVQRRLSAVPYTVFPNLKSNKDRLQRSPRTRACARTCSPARRAPACRSRCGCHTRFCKPARGFTAVPTHCLRL